MAASVYDNIIHLLASLLKGQINRFTKKQNFSLTSCGILLCRFLLYLPRFGLWDFCFLLASTVEVSGMLFLWFSIEKLYLKKNHQQRIFPEIFLEVSFNPPNILSVVFRNILSGKTLCYFIFFVFFKYSECLKQNSNYHHFIRMEAEIWKPNTIYMTRYH